MDQSDWFGRNLQRASISRGARLMAKRIENECAYCAEAVEFDEAVIGQDWKVYCSNACAQAGETISQHEWQRVMRDVTNRREYVAQEQAG
jgi:hypothetical protein